MASLRAGTKTARLAAPLASAPTAVRLPAATAAEIAEVAAAVGRSIGFVVERALAAAKLSATPLVPPADDERDLMLTLDEDDPSDLRTRIAKRAGDLPLSRAIAGAWLATRARFVAWVERERAARTAEAADDLDAALRAAQSPTTSPAELTALGGSVYPRVRALVASHRATPAATLQLLARDREPYVRDAVANRR